MARTDNFTEFVSRHWPSSEEYWFKSLALSGWIGVDWPPEFGGTGSARQEQLALIQVLAEHRCPVMPDSVAVIAPLLLAHGSVEQKEYYLPRIHDNPLDYTFQTTFHAEKGVNPGCLLDTDSGRLYLVSDDGSRTPFCDNGEADSLLASSYSSLWLLYEKLLGLTHLKNMCEYWEEENSIDIAELEIEVSSLTVFFLQQTETADRQIGLRVNRDRPDLYASLFLSLGYYALLSPDSTFAANEPLPFAEEREYLLALRKQVARNDMLQMDLLFNEHVSYEEP